MKERLEIKVTKIRNRWHCRLLEDGKVIDESACALKEDIGWLCREALRWYSKLGGCSKFAESARRRQLKTKPIGQIYLGLKK